MLQKMIYFWVRYVHPSFSTLISTIGTLGLISCSLSLWLLAYLAEEVWEKEAFSFDRTVLLWIHQGANPVLDLLMLSVTKLGNPTVVTPIALAVFLLFWWQRYRQQAILFAIACLGGAILSTGLKLVFNKPRPDLWKPLITETSYSFPSGHALGSVVLYGMTAYLLAERYPHLTRQIYGLAITLILAISFSRLYLGVHWLTDILAGWGVGFLWIIVCVTMQRLRQFNA